MRTWHLHRHRLHRQSILKGEQIGTNLSLLHPTWTVLLSFFLLNALLFLPLWLLNWDETLFWPIRSIWSESGVIGWRELWSQLFDGRDNFDPFRLNIELWLVLALLANIGWLRRPFLRPLFVLLYFVLLCYYIYEAITLSIYQSEPVFYNHYYMALDGLGYLFDHLTIANGTYWFLGALGCIAIWLVYRLASFCYQSALQTQWGMTPRLSLLAFGCVMLFLLSTQRETLAAPTKVFSSLGFKIEENFKKSVALYQEVSRFDDSALQAAYNYSAFTLPRKPNIYFLFIESYGSVLYKRPDYRIDYSLLLKDLKQQLDGAGLYSASTLSEAPTWGGGSWLSYTSTQFGLRIDNHPYYLTLLNKYQFQRYPHLGTFLQDQGYRSYRLSSLSVNLATDSWERYERMYNVDQWFRFEDLNYAGPLYGWGPAVPDQYALHYAHEQIVNTTGVASVDDLANAATGDMMPNVDNPFMLFFITQNSHYPFAPLPPLVEEWQSLNTLTDHQDEVDDETRDHDVRRQDYFNAIDYDLRMVTQFILQNEQEDALYILIGDHQPPRVSRRTDGFDTPIHVISRDPALIAAFYEHGFTSGLWVNQKEPTMKHEGFYSMLVRALLTDEERNQELPPYLADGFILPDGVLPVAP